MRKLWLWIILVAMSAALIIGGWSWNQSQSSSPPGSAQQVPFSSPLSPIPPTPLNPDRLLTDLKALSFKRFEESDRQRARDYILASLQQAGWTPQLQPFDSGINGINGINIVAERAGTDPTAGKILLGAHYDTVEVSPGADDNATGVVTVLEAARLLGNLRTPRTLQLVLFDREEQGVFGSKAFIESLPASDKVAAAVILDMIGYGCYTDGCQSYPPVLPVKPPTHRGDFLAVLGDQGHLPLINIFPQAVYSDLPPVLTLAIPTLGPLAPDLVRSDHKPFWNRGIGAVLVTDTANFRNPHYHQPQDTLETIDAKFFQGAAQVVINAVTALLQTAGSLATSN